MSAALGDSLARLAHDLRVALEEQQQRADEQERQVNQERAE